MGKPLENEVSPEDVSMDSFECLQKTHFRSKSRSSEKTLTVEDGSDSDSSSSTISTFSEALSESEKEQENCIDPTKFLACDIKMELDESNEETLPFMKSQNYQLNCK